MATPTLAAPPRQSLAARFLDWEDWLTFALALGAMLGVSLSLEQAGWSTEMPNLTLVGFLALLAAILLARSRLHMLLSWPLAGVMGAAVVFWRTLDMAGPGDIGQRVDAIYFRFQTWFQLAFSGGISNDPMPFNVMVIGLTWLGVFLFGWSLYRWHNAWLGLIPGGVALFMNLLFIDESLPVEVFLYVMCGFLLVMRTNLMAHMREWRSQGVAYPPLISLTFLHYAFWAGLFLIVAAWLSPVGPWSTPTPVAALSERLEGIGVHFVRLAGPLRVKKLAPVHDYTGVLPFQGSLSLRETELLKVDVQDPFVQGPIVLRGAVYEEYSAGGWTAGPREEVEVPAVLGDVDTVREQPGSRIVPVQVTVESKSVVGSVLFTPGRPLSADEPALAKLAEGAVTELSVVNGGAPSRRRVGPRIFLPIEAGESLSDEDALDSLPANWTGLYVTRDERGRIERIGAIPSKDLPDVLVLTPREKLREGESYTVLGLVADISPEKLRHASGLYPAEIASTYLQLPDIPSRVRELARQVAAEEIGTYDRAKAVESYLRQFPVDYAIPPAPPGQDTVDYFLFDAQRGYFDYHASAMVVMLRALGIPSRLVVGFVVDQEDIDEESGSYVVEHRDAYAWAEAYLPGFGWVDFNPSPDRPADLRPSDRPEEILVPPLSLEDVEGLPIADGSLFPDFGDASGEGGGGLSFGGGGSGVPVALWLVLALAGLAAAVAASAALGWRQGVAGLPYAQQVWEKTVRLASWAGAPPQPGQTPSAFARDLSRRIPDRPDVEALATAYNRSRFGHKQPDPEEDRRLAAIWRRLRVPLFREVIRRLWRRT